MSRARKQAQFAICVQNEGCDDLVLRKVYQVIPDEAAARDGCLRVIDESGEDYLYPANYFVTLDLPRGAEQAFAGAASRG